MINSEVIGYSIRTVSDPQFSVLCLFNCSIGPILDGRAFPAQKSQTVGRCLLPGHLHSNPTNIRPTPRRFQTDATQRPSLPTPFPSTLTDCAGKLASYCYFTHRDALMCHEDTR